jgi:pimeloyl-ACP methyl ester carboxylesterase
VIEPPRSVGPSSNTLVGAEGVSVNDSQGRSACLLERPLGANGFSLVEPIEAEYLTIRANAPDWFRMALSRSKQSRYVVVEGCPIHYFLWPGRQESSKTSGLLFVHGAGAHANWWSFIAPFFARDFRVAALDRSGAGDSGRRSTYGSALRVEEMRAVIADAGLGTRPIVIGHSFGGLITTKYAFEHGNQLGGAVLVDSPIRSLEEERAHPITPPQSTKTRIYDTFEKALAHFRLEPPQSCRNQYIVEFIARHSLRPVDGGWTWKFDGTALGDHPLDEPFRDYLGAARCRMGLIYGQRSALVSRETASYMSTLMGVGAPVVEVADSQHHVMLDQPLAFIAALRTMLGRWSGPDG